MIGRRKKAKLAADYDEERLKAEIADYKEMHEERSRRKAAIASAKADIEERGVPSVEKPKVYNVGKDDEVKGIVEPRNERNNTTEVKIDSSGDGKTDTIMTYHRKRGLMSIEDIEDDKTRPSEPDPHEDTPERRSLWDSITGSKSIERNASRDAGILGSSGDGKGETEDRRRPQKVGVSRRRPRLPKKRGRRKNRYRENILR